MTAAQHVQARLAGAGFPAPRPLLEPTPLAHGIAIVETLLDCGQRADAHDPTIRRTIADSLARLIELTRPLASMPGLIQWREAADRLWRQPHDRRFDFTGTADSANWTDRLAAEARKQLDEHATGPSVIGHGDWRVEHLRFRRGTLTAAYDWDSLAVGPEPVFAGAAAHAFTADWTAGRPNRFPELGESLAFLNDYQSARCAPFNDHERCAARAALVATMAYSARCEHSDLLTAYGTRPPLPTPARPPGDGVIHMLSQHGEQLLAGDNQ